MPAVAVSGVSKRYRVFSRGSDRLVESLTLGKVKRGRDFWALEDVSFEVERGVSLGILGRNGAGKSTLLSVIAGVMQPTHGSVTVNGRLVALLQLGAGFKLEYTGRENAMLNGLILGMSRQDMIRRMDEIEAFADIGEFMDQPVKTYSSGMRARLGFAVAVNVKPDVLLVDETLSVGDAVFQHKGMEKMRQLRASGATILFVSHSLNMIRDFCDEGALLHQGRLLAMGEASEALDRYETLVSELGAGDRKAAPGTAPKKPPPVPQPVPRTPPRDETMRHGTGEAQVESVEILDGRGRPLLDDAVPEAPLKIRAHIRYEEDVRESALRVVLRNKAGLDIYSTTTELEGAPLGPRRAGETVMVDFNLASVPLRQGSYSVTVALLDRRAGNRHLDWVAVAAVFKLSRPRSRRAIRGLVHLPTEVEITSPDRAGSPGR